MTASDRTDDVQERANSLYWNSDDTVDQVAGELGITRTALYSAVRPHSAGADCPECGSGLVYPNRSSRSAGRAMCLSCERTFSTAEIDSGQEGGAAGGYARWSAEEHRHDHDHEQGGAAYEEARQRLRQWREDLASVEPRRVFMIGGAAVLGVLVGMAAASAVRR